MLMNVLGTCDWHLQYIEDMNTQTHTPKQLFTAGKAQVT
jgi:hypothetical protein